MSDCVRGGRGRWLGVVLAAGLAGCASLPTAETSAFDTLAAAGQTSFTTLATTEEAEVQADQVARIASGRKILMLGDDCVAASASRAPCVVVAADPGATSPDQGLKLVSHTARLRALIGGVSDYASAMADLAAARDVQAADDATARAAGCLKSLAGIVDPRAGAVAAPTLDALVFANGQLQREQRRRLMLAIARPAQGVVDGAADVMGREAEQLRGTLLVYRQRRLTDLKQAYDEDRQHHTLSEADRASLTQQIIQAAADLSAVRAIDTDFTPLRKSHAALVAVLANPRADVNESVLQAQAFAKVLQGFAALAPARAHG
ncbi:MAG TPA: hypothetical protein VG939_11705 [Caulobacteraceae bacterium]|nr:hypothetical protein [Caulobacteraceae bacterium]